MSQYLMYQIRGRVFRHILTVAICRLGKKKSDKNIFFKLLVIVLICMSVLYSV